MRLPILTERDRRLLSGLDDFGVLSTRQIQKLFFQGINIRTLLRRLRILERRKLIQRASGLKRGLHVWTLTSIGLAFAGPGGVPCLINKNTLEHDICFNDIRIHLEGGGVGTHWKTSYYFKRIASQNKSSYDRNEDVIPDGLFAIKTPQGSQVFAVELKLHAKGKRRYRKVFKGYGRKNIYRLWYWVSSESLGRRLAEEWKHHRPYQKRDEFLVWTPIDELLSDLRNVKLRSVEGSVLLHELCPLIIPAHTTAHSVGGKEKFLKPTDSSNLANLQSLGQFQVGI